jgi:hypothetical protein
MHGDGCPFRCKNCGFVSQTDQIEFDCPPDRTLIGNRIEALTKAIGIPACGGCAERRVSVPRTTGGLFAVGLLAC